jgi:endonuclease YncB( thermonuclease family)
MPSKILSPALIPQTYAELRAAVEMTMIRGQRDVDMAKVRTYHETGRLIREHVLANQDRADYGAQTIPRLAADLKLDRSVLQRCDKFYRAFPIWATWPKLTWAHFRTLIPIADRKLRRSLATEANRNEWPVVRLEARIAELAPAEEIEVVALPGGESPELLKPNRGTPGVYRVAKVEGALVVDLGFANYLDLTEDQAETFKAGDLVNVDGNGRITPAPDATKADLFTYRVEIIKVVDGDTLWVKIYLRPRQWIKQKLRLRGLDCPELKTPEGKVAKRFVDALVAKTTAVVINTTKADKYDRYLADVFLRQAKDVAGLVEPGPGSATPATVLAETGDLFLNNALLANGHAVQKEEWEFGDWGFEA